MKTNRINAGSYELKVNGRTFKIEAIHVVSESSQPGWMVYENGNYLNDYSTKRSAVAAAIEIANVN